MLWDTHMHTAFSTDSETSPESMIKASIELGLGGICITDHMDYDYPKEHPEDEPEFILDTPVSTFILSLYCCPSFWIVGK